MTSYPPDPPPPPGKAVYRTRRYRHTCGAVSALLRSEEPGDRCWCSGCRNYVPTSECVWLDGRPMKE
jgi:hypothetical protein